MRKIKKGIFIRGKDNYIKFENIDYIYFGDSDCDFKFISIINNSLFIDYLLNLNKTLVLVTPIFTHTTKKQFKQFLLDNKKKIYSIDFEFVINSWGIYFLLKKIFGGNVKIIWGKWMYYQIKDPMVKKLNHTLKGNINIDFNFYNDFLKENNILGLEVVNLENNFSILNLDIPIHIYYPKIAFSSIKYCYSWNIYKKNKILKIVDKCFGCDKKSINYSFYYGGNEIIYKDNTFYYKNYKTQNIKNKATRLIYNYYE